MKQRVEFDGIVFEGGKKYNLLAFEPNEINTNYETSAYIGQDGYDITGSYYEPRVIMLNGHILGKSHADFYNSRQRLIEVCDGKTEKELMYFNRIKRYSATAIAQPPIFEERQGLCLPFSIKFIVPSFYWKDSEAHAFPVAKYTPLIVEGFIFNPTCVFGELTTEAEIYNHSGINTPFKITIIGKGDNPSAETGLIITNETTGDLIHIKKDIAKDEIISIDTEKVTITSSVDGNLLTYITDDSKPNMRLTKGGNLIKAENLNITNEVEATLTYRNWYIGV